MDETRNSPSGWDQEIPQMNGGTEDPTLGSETGEETEAPENETDTSESDPPAEDAGGKKRRGKKAKKGKKHWFARHKILTVLLVLVLAGGAFFAVRYFTKTAKTSGSTYEFIRTTTLKKTSLENSVSATGTVASGSVANVTVADGVKLYKVKDVSVKVGDTVNEGDVICTLDTTDLEKSIASAKLNYSDTLQSAQTSYNRALDDYNTYTTQHDNNLIDLQAKIDDANSNLSDAQTTLTTANSTQSSAQSTYDSCKNTVSSLQSAYNAAQGISAYVSAYDSAADALNGATKTLDAAYQAYTTAYMQYTADSNKKDALSQAVSALQAAWNTYGDNTSTAIDTVTNLKISSTNQRTVTLSTSANADDINKQLSGTDLLVTNPTSNLLITNFNAAATNLLTQESAATSGTGMNYQDVINAYTKAQSGLTAAQSALDQAKAAVTSAQKNVDTCTSGVTSAQSSYDNEKNYSNLKSKYQSLQDAKTKLDQAKRTPDTLTDLLTSLSECTLTATMSGTVTALNATVGSTCSSTVATIQDTNGLSVDITIAADKVSGVSTGMTCNITSDTTDKTITGKLTQIDPSANDSGTFGATVTVTGDSTGLLIGIQAKVEILQSQTDNVFVVPIDAIGTNDDGTSFVYRKTGGEGVDMTFEKVTVTAGTKNDYYTEITGDDLAEGDVIRSSSDLTEGTESSDSSSTTTTTTNMGGMQMGGAEMSGGMGAGGGGNGGGGAPGGM